MRKVLLPVTVFSASPLQAALASTMQSTLRVSDMMPYDLGKLIMHGIYYVLLYVPHLYALYISVHNP